MDSFSPFPCTYPSRHRLQKLYGSNWVKHTKQEAFNGACRGLFGYIGTCRAYGIVENQVDKNMESYMETGMIQGLWGWYQ